MFGLPLKELWVVIGKQLGQYIWVELAHWACYSFHAEYVDGNLPTTKSSYCELALTRAIGFLLPIVVTSRVNFHTTLILPLSYLPRDR